MDRGDFDRPHGFRVRYYDDTLNYKIHSVIPYKTANLYHLIYKVMRSPDKINVWFASNSIVAHLNYQGDGIYGHFTKDYTAQQIVCAMLSQNGRLVVVDEDSFQPALF